MAGISGVAIALAVVSALNAVWLGRKMQRLAGGAELPADLDVPPAPVEQSPAGP